MDNVELIILGNLLLKLTSKDKNPSFDLGIEDQSGKLLYLPDKSLFHMIYSPNLQCAWIHTSG